MRSYALAFVLSLGLLPVTTGCSSEKDYAVVVTWAINGKIPDAALCQEQGLARARFEVRRRGKEVETLEANCDSLTTLANGDVWGGFETTNAFDWDTTYEYTLSLLDASGGVRNAFQGTFYNNYDDGWDVYEIPWLDYLQPEGNVASLNAEWTARGTEPLAAACQAKNIGTVALEVTTILDPDFVQQPHTIASTPCADGRFSSEGRPILATGSYLFRLRAFSPGGSEVAVSETFDVDVEGVQSNVALPRVTFDF